MYVENPRKLRSVGVLSREDEVSVERIEGVDVDVVFSWATVGVAIERRKSIERMQLKPW